MGRVSQKQMELLFDGKTDEFELKSIVCMILISLSYISS